ncbi:DUF6461 domain-containing protein [Streptomyces sp. CB01881]|uniref:DUF6461 domain-containing protein n=1 Tax=Streptomyces sp. CB01881 TaxID=2078691 RepID=UPI000CDC4A6C|nr:DUF6461 domain-containing protein [Streptomyces sp. CB01881]AUY49058.1 hypothetical protein C2142_09005 [Streptomyces sp. CB01881]TYC77549.1 hypothetical protein EH183_09010 [Streptomyces sp. CB01881]
MSAHATDFTWFDERYPDLAEAYCLTHVQGISADELLRRFDAAPGRSVTGLAAVVQAWETFDDGEDEHAPYGDEDLMLVAVTELDGWAVAVEVNGYLGSLWDALPRLAEGTRLVSHFRNCNAVDSFHWQEGAANRLHFEPLFPTQRDGEDAEAPGIAELLAHCGFDLTDDEHAGADPAPSPDTDPDAAEARPRLHTEAAFALAERLTDVRLTPERLDAAGFRLGYAPVP